MEDNFRNVLIILSGIVIGAIFIHGLWTIRKQKNPYKLKASKDKIEPLSRNFDGKGFDQDGVGQVVVKNTGWQQDDDTENTEQFSSQNFSTQETFIEPDLVEASSGNADIKSHANIGDNFNRHLDTNLNANLNNNLGDNLGDNLGQSLDDNLGQSLGENINENINGNLDDSLDEQWFDGGSPKNFSKDELGDDLTPEVTQEEVKASPREPLYEQPVINAKPAINPSKKYPRQSIGKSPDKTALKRNQMEINFGEAKAKDEALPVTTPNITLDDTVDNTIENSTDNTVNTTGLPSSSQEQPKSKHVDSRNSEKANIEPQVIIISVVMPPNQQMLGASLLPSLLTLGLRYGEMNIFHRHQDNAGNGAVTFSLANMMKPGSFDLDSIETFATQGISLFMTLPNTADSFAVFEQMLSAAKQLAQEFNGQILDDKRHVMTAETEQDYVNKIRDFDRRSRIALVE